MAQTFSLEDVMLAAMDARLEGVYTAGLGIVQAYDKAKQMASVQPAARQAYINEPGDRVAERLPVIPCVPIVFPRFGPFRIIGPVAVGDTVVLVHLHHAKDRVLCEGGEVDPGDDRRHTLTDCVALAGYSTFKSVLKNVPDDSLSLGHDEGITIEITEDAIKLGDASTSTGGVVRKSDLQALKDGLDARAAVLAAGLPATAAELDTVSAIISALPPGWPTASTKVFAE